MLLEFLKRVLARWQPHTDRGDEPDGGDADSRGGSEGNRHQAAARRSSGRSTGVSASRIAGEASIGAKDLKRARRLIRETFTPVHPVTSRAHFAGRREVLKSIIDAVEEQRAHVVVFGERGIGKTSLMHVLGELARESGYLVVYASCGNRSDFDELFRSVLRKIPLNSLAETIPAAPDSGLTLADRLSDGLIGARELSEVCAGISGVTVLIILDEYDRVEADEFRQATAELMKNLSDRAARVQLVLAGVSSNIRELIGHIPSVRRNVVGIPVPRFSDEEVRTLIGDGEKTVGIHFEEEVISQIVMLANGSPYLVRLISHHASIHALDAGQMVIESGHLVAALDQMLTEAEQRLPPELVRRFEQWSTQHGNDPVVAAARAANSADGWFTADDIGRRLGVPLNHEHVSRMAREADLLETDASSGKVRYRFRDEALASFIWLSAGRRQLGSE